MRSRFAFGRITSTQAGTNTQRNYDTYNTDTITPDTSEERTDWTETPNNTEITNHTPEQEEFEEDPFQFDELPNKDNCA